MSHWVRVILQDAKIAHEALPDHVLKGLRRITEIIEVSEVPQFRTDELTGIADAMSVCSDMRELSRLLWKVTTICGFQNFSLFVTRQGGAATFPKRLCTSLNDKWLRQYIAQSYQFVDPVLHRASQEDGGFLFSELSYSCPLVKDFWEDADRHGIGRNGFCHALTKPNGSRLAISYLTSATEAQTRDAMRLNVNDLIVISELAIDCFCNFSSGHSVDEEDLSIHELKFLHVVATSQSPETALSQEPGHCSTESLQASIRRKLNVGTIFQAVSVASARRLFDALPYYSEEIISPFPELADRNQAVLDQEG